VPLTESGLGESGDGVHVLLSLWCEEWGWSWGSLRGLPSLTLRFFSSCCHLSGLVRSHTPLGKTALDVPVGGSSFGAGQGGAWLRHPKELLVSKPARPTGSPCQSSDLNLTFFCPLNLDVLSGQGNTPVRKALSQPYGHL